MLTAEISKWLKCADTFNLLRACILRSYFGQKNPALSLRSSVRDTSVPKLTFSRRQVTRRHEKAGTARELPTINAAAGEMGRNSRAVAAAAPVAGVPSRASAGAGTGVWSESRSPPVAETPPRRQHSPQKSRAPPPPPPPTAQPQAPSGNAQQTTPSPQQHTWQIGKRRAPQPPSTYCLDKASLHLASTGSRSLRRLGDTPRTVLATPRAPQLQIVAENLSLVEAVNRVLTGELSDSKMPAVLTQKPSGNMQKVSPARARNSYFFGEFDHHVTASLTTNLSEASEGSSTDVGVCLSDSASDISQDSLAETSDSAVSSPTVRRVSFESSEPAGTQTQHADLRLAPSSRCPSRPTAAELTQTRTSASSSVVTKMQSPVHQSQPTTRQSQSPIRQSSELLRQKPKKPIPVPQVFESHYEATIAVPQKQNSLYVSSLRLTQSRSNDDGTIGGGIKDSDSVSHDVKTHRRRGAAESSLQESPLKLHQTASPKPSVELPCSPPARPPKPSAIAQTCSPHRKTSQNKAKPRPSSSMTAHSKTGPASLRPRPVSCVSPSASAVMRASLSVLDDFPSRPHSIHLASSPSEVGFHFHLNEMEAGETAPEPEEEDDGFAGVKDFLVPTDTTIRSGRGTVRGVKNRVRAGIATFLHGNTITKVSPSEVD